MNVWESIFTQSPVNYGYYYENDLPHQNWNWPRGTWFQERLDYIREHQLLLIPKNRQKMGEKAIGQAEPQEA